MTSCVVINLNSDTLNLNLNLIKKFECLGIYIDSNFIQDLTPWLNLYHPLNRNKLMVQIYKILYLKCNLVLILHYVVDFKVKC